MLIIRKKQMDTLRDYMLKQFKNRMIVHLKSNFPEQAKDMKEQDLQNMIQSGIDKAKGYDVLAEEDVQRFLECMMTYGTEFDVNPETLWAGDILRRKDISGSMKMDLMDNYEIFYLGS